MLGRVQFSLVMSRQFGLVTVRQLGRVVVGYGWVYCIMLMCVKNMVRQLSSGDARCLMVECGLLWFVSAVVVCCGKKWLHLVR